MDRATPETVLGDARAYRNTIDDCLVQNRWCDSTGEARPFASVEGVSVDTADTRATPEASSDATDLTLGGSFGLGDGWLIGAAIGSQSSEADIDDLGSSFESGGLMGSLFVGWRCDIWFADAVLLQFLLRRRTVEGLVVQLAATGHPLGLQFGQDAHDAAATAGH